MNKVKIVSGLAGVVAAAAMILPASAFAATNNTFLTFPNSGPNATIAAGDAVDTKVTFDLTGSSELESMSLQIVDNAGNNIGMPETCFDVADRVVAGTFTRVGNFDTTGGTEGTFGIRVRSYGVTGPGTDNNCGGTVTSNDYFSNRLTLTEGQNSGGNANNTGGGSGNTSGSPSQTSVLAAILAWIQGHSGSGTPAPAPAPSTACATLNTKLLGTMDNTYNSANVMLQGYLLSEGESIPALAAGASFGYKGPQTNAALSHFKAAHQCI